MSDPTPSTSRGNVELMRTSDAQLEKKALENRIKQVKKDINKKVGILLSNMKSLKAKVEVLKGELDYLNTTLKDKFDGNVAGVQNAEKKGVKRSKRTSVQPPVENVAFENTSGSGNEGGIGNLVINAGAGCTIIVKTINYPKPLTHIHNDKPDHQTINNSKTNDNPCSSKASVEIRSGDGATLHAPHVNQKVEDSSGDEDSEKDSEDNLSDDDDVTN